MSEKLVTDKDYADFYQSGWNAQKSQRQDYFSTQAAVALETRSIFPDFVVFEDEDLLIVNKPAGLNTHRTDMQHLGILEIAQDYHGGIDLFAVNRLDNVTSGATVLAKNKDSYNALREQFGNKDQPDMRKMYVALLDGHVSDTKPAEITTYIAPTNTKPFKMKVVKPSHPNAKDAVTQFTPLALYQDPDTQALFTLTQARIFTGRTHQIRISAAQALAPTIRGISGDPLYNPESQTTPRCMLHSYEVDFRHPRTQKLHKIIAYPTDDFLYQFEGLRLLRRFV